MLVFKYLSGDPTLESGLDKEYLAAQAAGLGPDVSELWESIKEVARAEADLSETSD